MLRGATCSPISKAITIGGASTPPSATSPHSRQRRNTRNPVSTFPGKISPPLGPPSDAAFQKRVLVAALHMLVEDGGPLRIVDFPDDDPRARPDLAWRPPFMPAAVANGLADSLASWLEEEVLLLHGAHQRWMAQHGRSTIGLSGLAIAE